MMRSFALKHIKNWSYRNLFNEMQRNLDYRAFTQFFDDKLRSVSALSRNGSLADEQALRELNARLREIAREEKVIAGKMFRQDTTACESNIHYPTDSSLMQDGIRILTRTVKRAEQIAPSLGLMRDFSRAALHRVLEIHRAARGKGEKAEKKMENSYRSLMRITRSVASHTKKVAKKLGDGRFRRHMDMPNQLRAQGLHIELETMLPRVERVLRQTRMRVCKGITNYQEKIFSLFEPEAYAISKGKAHKSTEFGKLIEIVEVENGFVSDYQVHDGNPNDAPMLVPALKRHKECFGHPPRVVATDRGFWSAKNEKEAYALGVKRVSIPARGKLSKIRQVLQRKRWFRNLQRWRANGEGRISTLKNRFGLDRCMYKGDKAMERWVGWCVFANNLLVVARKTKNRNRQRTNERAA
jgi:IS5 family transposase